MFYRENTFFVSVLTANKGVACVTVKKFYSYQVKDRGSNLL